MRTMGLDLGTRTIGVAVSDELGLTAQPVTTLRRRSLSADLLELNRLAHAHQVERWVVGLPLNMNGTEGPKAAQAREFGAALETDSGDPGGVWGRRLPPRAPVRGRREGALSPSKRPPVHARGATHYGRQRRA